MGRTLSPWERKIHPETSRCSHLGDILGAERTIFKPLSTSTSGSKEPLHIPQNVTFYLSRGRIPRTHLSILGFSAHQFHEDPYREWASLRQRVELQQAHKKRDYDRRERENQLLMSGIKDGVEPSYRVPYASSTSWPLAPGCQRELASGRG